MNHLENLNKYLKENNDVSYFDSIKNLIKQRVTEMDNSVPKLLNKAFGHRYSISCIEKDKMEGNPGLFGNIPDYDGILYGQYQQIYQTQNKMNKMKIEYKQLKKAYVTICLLNNYQQEINALSEQVNNTLEEDLKAISVKYLFNEEYQQKLIDSYVDGLEKEGLELWNIKCLEDIKVEEILNHHKQSEN